MICRFQTTLTVGSDDHKVVGFKSRQALVEIDHLC